MTKAQQSIFRRIGWFLLTFLFLMFAPISAYAAEPFEVHVLDVGQGQAVLIEADDHYMLIDGGGRASSSFVVSYLKQNGIETLDLIAVSHYDEDHMSGTIGVLSAFPCGTLLLPPYAGVTDLYRSLAVAAVSNGCLIMHPGIGETFSLGTAEIKVICPVRTDYVNENDLSLGFYLSFNNTSTIICGDAEQEGEFDMARENAGLQADLYVANHHGSSTSSTDVFLNSFSPSYAVISCGKENVYGHPSAETLQRLQNHGAAIYRTDIQGTVIAFSDGEDIWFNTDSCDSEGSENGTILSLGMLDGSWSDEGITRQMPLETELQAEEQEDFAYVCNTSTMKFHYPECDSVAKMKEKNRLYTNLSREELLAEGYKPCGSCHP